MSKSTVIKLSDPDLFTDSLTELLRTGARQLIEQAVEAELSEFMKQYADQVLGNGRSAIVRNGHLPEREIQTGIRPVTVKIPKVRAKNEEAVTFRSALVPPYVRKTRSLEAALPWLYLKGISTGEMGSALEVLVGPEAKGLSASTVAKLKQRWAEDYRYWREMRLDKDQWVYIWADGIYSGLRAEDAKLCALVIIGVDARGMNAPKMAIGDGAMGFWSALEEIYPDTRHQRCWLHKTLNVLNAVPQSIQPKVKHSLHKIWQAETREQAHRAFDLFINTFEAKYPKATLTLRKDRDELLAFYDFPAQHWQSLRTTNPIESTFGTLRHRTKRSKGCLTRNGMLHMMFKLAECAQNKWRRQRGFDYLAKVIT